MILPRITDHCLLGTSSQVRGFAAATGGKREYTEAEKNACSLDTMLNGGTCEACQ